jgi:hypothetical protein
MPRRCIALLNSCARVSKGAGGPTRAASASRRIAGAVPVVLSIARPGDAPQPEAGRELCAISTLALRREPERAALVKTTPLLAGGASGRE